LKKSLLNNQNEYFRTSVAEMQEPRPMLELLEEYISEHQLLSKGWQEGQDHPGLKSLSIFQTLQLNEALKHEC
jgi:hypothetical protein